jgi:hypothetical protein
MQNEYRLPLADTIVSTVNFVMLILLSLFMCLAILARNLFQVPRTSAKALVSDEVLFEDPR